MLNRITITGRLCADPDLRRTQPGTPVTSIRIACDRDFGKGEEKETDFLDVVAWRGTAEFICRYFTKGRLITVDGRLQTRGWTDKQGNKRVAHEIIADHAYFGDSKPSEADGGAYGGYDQGAGQYGGYGAAPSAPGPAPGGFAPEF